MEYVDGGSLLERCRESVLPIDQAIELSCQLCDGLAKAHDLGIVHRDIKPANVLLTKDGIPKLTDFGLAKAQASDHGQTVTGAVMGTPDFMPPEQRRDASLVDHRSDLWSLAATVYQMLTGRSPKIIRFDLLPGELTKVLGKALEDAKEDRYQSAREFRDAIKTSLRAANAVEELIEGACPACGVKNESSRRFCRGCGESLETPCLSCAKPMPMWEEICGSCGAKQTPLVEEQRQAMAAKQAEAEGLLGDFNFDGAVRIAVDLRSQPQRRLQHLAGWAETFLQRVEKSRGEQFLLAAEAFFEALKHEAACDFLSAIYILDSIPDAMRSVVLPGARESVTAVLSRIKQKQAESSRLEAIVRKRVEEKSFDGLLPEVEKLLVFQPGRGDILTLQRQLRDRQRKQEMIRDEAIATSWALLAKHDYEGAVAAFHNVPALMMTPNISRLRVEAEKKAAEVSKLHKEIRSAVSGKRVDGLIHLVETYLKLKPADKEMGRLRQVLVAREEKVTADIAARVTQARTLTNTLCFADAVAVIDQIPESRLAAGAAALKQACCALEEARREAQAAFTASSKSGDYDTFVTTATRYQSLLKAHSLKDDALTDKILESEQKMRSREAARQTAAMLRRYLRASQKIGLFLLVTAATVVGIYILALEKFDGSLDAFVFKWAPIMLLLCMWAAILKKGVESWHDE